jgi:hypothetical protein
MRLMTYRARDGAIRLEPQPLDMVRMLHEVSNPNPRGLDKYLAGLRLVGDGPIWENSIEPPLESLRRAGGVSPLMRWR